jgi:hypothetical protein
MHRPKTKSANRKRDAEPSGDQPPCRANIGRVTSKERLHKLVDELPDSELEPFLEWLSSFVAGQRDSPPDDAQSGGAEHQAKSDA